MSELLLKVGDRSSRDNDYKDGDILCAFNDKNISCVHAQNICHINKARRNSDGLIVLTEHSKDWFENTHKFRFERISLTEVRRINLITLEEEIFSNIPNKQNQAIDVRLFLSGVKLRTNHFLFGQDGAEIWYRDPIDISQDKLDLIWNAIETKTEYRKESYTKWPMGILDIKHHLPITVDNFDDQEAENLVSSEINEENNSVIQKRLNKIDWQNNLELTNRQKQDVLDKMVVADLREFKEYFRNEIVDIKQTNRIK